MNGEKVRLGDICELKYGKSLSKKVREAGEFCVYGSNGVVDNHVEGFTSGKTIIIGRKGSIGEVAFSDGSCWPIDTTYYVDETATKQDARWLYYTLGSLGLTKLNKSAAIPGLNRNDAYDKELWLPPLAEQKRIAGILDQAAELCRLRTRALEKLNTLGQAIFYEMFGSVHSNPNGFQRVVLGDLIKVSSGQGLTAKEMIPGDFPVYGGNGINGFHNEGPVGANRIVIGRVGVYCGAVHVTNHPCWVTDNALLVRQLQPCSVTYLAEALRVADLNQYAGRAAQPLISGSRIYPVEILLPPEDQQKRFGEALQAITRQQYSAERASNKIRILFASLQHRAFRGEL
ncbi:type I restriction enzyme, S subunit [Thalassovita litoralis]|uniref:Type I restriction enzyme, S subunit n=1 Tax=Thalassovita litoralis TaxID=1010611 RepID=A0A521FBI1_9RHOB|nr:restriction endonuclease subunit S [Thalassovita litoralis]SMO93503.1 type I restriction enzyme, S subunit [Thalassovita litoralis]